MAQQTINNGESGLIVRGKINENFTELYTDKAPLASPTFTGTPAAPTAAQGTNTTQVASTAFVAAADTATLATAQAYTDSVANAAKFITAQYIQQNYI